MSDASFGPYVCFFFLTCFFVTNSCIIGSTYKLMTEKGGNEGNGPKRRVLRRLGHKYVFFFSITFFMY